jgi:hypothetical protein
MFSNLPQPQTGASIRIRWPREVFERDDRADATSKLESMDLHASE